MHRTAANINTTNTNINTNTAFLADRRAARSNDPKEQEAKQVLDAMYSERMASTAHWQQHAREIQARTHARTLCPSRYH